MRTEQEILLDFEKLGWKVYRHIGLDMTLRYNTCEIWIDRINKNYSCNTAIDMQEHKLLNELFHCWGWL